MKKKTKAKKIKKAKKPAARKKVARKKVKPAKASKKKAPKKAKTKAAAAPRIAGDKIGVITHYFPHVNATVVKVSKGDLRIGDLIYIKGHTTDLKMTVQSLQIDHAPIQKAVKGDEAGLGVTKRTRPGDKVYKLKP